MKTISIESKHPVPVNRELVVWKTIIYIYFFSETKNISKIELIIDFKDSNLFLRELTFKVCAKSENHVKMNFLFYIFSYLLLGV